MPSGRKSTSTCAFFLPTVPLPPQTILSIETELSYFRHHLPLLLDTELRPFSLRNRAHPYQHPIPRRGVTPDRDCLDWPQYPLTHTVGATLRRSTPPLRARSRSRQPTPTPTLPARSRKPTPAARQPTPGPSAEKEITTIPHRAKSVRFLSPDGSGNGGDDGDSSSSNDDDDNEPLDARGGKVATPDADGLISKPDGEVGRLTRGGYSLPATLGWKQARFKSTKELVSSYVENYLSHSFSESNQPQGHVESLQKLILALHPDIVDQYRDGWPIRDMIHLRLKYTSGRFNNGQVVSQGSKYPQDPKKALKELRQQDKGKSQDKGKGKQRASAAS